MDKPNCVHIRSCPRYDDDDLFANIFHMGTSEIWESPVTIISFNENRAYLLPILSLAVLPTLQMFRMMVLYIKEEQGKHYVEVAYGKGLSSSYILCIHLFKNISIHFFHHLKRFCFLTF